MYAAGVAMLLYIAAVTSLCVYIYRTRTIRLYDIPPLNTQIPIDYICVNLPHRRNKLEAIRNVFQTYGVEIQAFDAVDGRNLNMDLYNTSTLTASYSKRIKSNPEQKGHLGAAFSHLGVLQLIIDHQKNRTLVVEDDCVLGNDFITRLQEALVRMDLTDPTWDILQLGYSCSYDDCRLCHRNDEISVQEGGIVKIGYSIGLFGYVVNGVKAAENIMNHVFPIDQHIDHHYQQMNLDGQIRMYGVIPNILFHPGKMVISSYGEVYSTNSQWYFSDTNFS